MAMAGATASRGMDIAIPSVSAAINTTSPAISPYRSRTTQRSARWRVVSLSGSDDHHPLSVLSNSLVRDLTGVHSIQPVRSRHAAICHAGHHRPPFAFCTISQSLETRLLSYRLGGQHDRRSCGGWLIKSFVGVRSTTPALRATPPNLGGEFVTLLRSAA